MKYGCHSDVSPDWCKHDEVTSPQYISVKWPFIFTRECHYEHKWSDDKCNGCKQPHETDTQVPEFLEW